MTKTQRGKHLSINRTITTTTTTTFNLSLARQFFFRATPVWLHARKVNLWELLDVDFSMLEMEALL